MSGIDFFRRFFFFRPPTSVTPGIRSSQKTIAEALAAGDRSLPLRSLPSQDGRQGRPYGDFYVGHPTLDMSPISADGKPMCCGRTCLYELGLPQLLCELSGPVRTSHGTFRPYARLLHLLHESSSVGRTNYRGKYAARGLSRAAGAHAPGRRFVVCAARSGRPCARRRRHVFCLEATCLARGASATTVTAPHNIARASRDGHRQSTLMSRYGPASVPLLPKGGTDQHSACTVAFRFPLHRCRPRACHAYAW